MDNYMLWVWLGIIVASGLIEILTTDLVSVWFCIGAIVALIFSFFTPLWAQLLIFVGVSAIALLATRPIVKRMKISKNNTNTDDFVGKEIVLLKEVSKFNPGEAKLNDVTYSVILEDNVDDVIEKETVVVIKSIKGNKLVIGRKGE